MFRKIPLLFFCLLWSCALSTCRFDPQPAEDYLPCEQAEGCPNPNCVCGATGVCLPLAGSSPSACSCTKDEDGDGYIDADSCDGARDCDDTRAGIHPGAFEACDEIDNDCDVSVSLKGVLSKTWSASVWKKDGLSPCPAA